MERAETELSVEPFRRLENGCHRDNTRYDGLCGMLRGRGREETVDCRSQENFWARHLSKVTGIHGNYCRAYMSILVE